MLVYIENYRSLVLLNVGNLNAQVIKNKTMKFTKENVTLNIEMSVRFYYIIIILVRRLQALGRTAPEYTMKWRSLSVIANTHKSGPSPAPNHVLDSSTGNGPREARILILFAMLLAYAAGC